MRYNIVYTFILYALLSLNIAYAEQITDVSGIYQSTDGSGNYVTINKKDNSYVIINITKEMDLLRQLFFVIEDEENILNPPIEEFAFFLPRGDDVNITLENPMAVDLIVDFPNRIAQSNEVRTVYIKLTRDKNDDLILDFIASSYTLVGTTKSYKRIF
jgi:hypothetical protein